MSPFVWDRRQFLSRALSGCAIATLSATGVARAASQFADPLDSPSQLVPDLARVPVLALARAGDRIVGVGLRGVIVISDDGGRSWKQVATPVQSDLTCLSFAEGRFGWAAGHDGVILHSNDGGLSWIKQLDGRQAGGLFAEHYRQRIGAGEDRLQPLLEQIEVNYANGPTLPFLGIEFLTPKIGYAVGSFGMLLRTNDGGRSWRPYLDGIENPDFLNLNAIRRIGADVYIVGERGMVFRWSEGEGIFKASSTGYAGSLFGIVGDETGVVLVFGLRGTIYRSDDYGAVWTGLRSPEQLTVVAGAVVRKGGETPKGLPILLNIAGRVLTATDSGGVLAAMPGGVRGEATDILVTAENEAVIASLSGLIRVDRLL